ncbi:hypothetical protein [Actinokineospora fastidiosa]|uniref:Uncharacterized protein n=1 Tax=Actinokineospora fastidiosa TaxID=1816 RepID=A0A918GMA0_9PSEU|nr:hypothetical protein [Actinokineospora fastidiosa]GGS46313.1 hypothetical protein GCM10010171_46900 [Actinokineospora fastidiosa]
MTARSTLGGALRVIAGRGTARACISLSAVVLLPAWGAERFGQYVAATGTFVFLVFLVMGAEKTLLTSVPRTTRLAHQSTRALLARAAAPVAVCVVVAAALAPVGGQPALYGLGAVYLSGQGLLSALASTHRLLGYPARDGLAFTVLAGHVLLATALAVAGYLEPYAYLLVLVAGVLAVCGVLAALVPAVRVRPARPRAGLGRLLTRRALLASVTDVADSASISVTYVALAALVAPAEVAMVYLALLASATLGGLALLVLRIAQPATSLRLRGTAGRTGRARARRISGAAVAVTAVALGVVLGVAALAWADGGVAAVRALGADPFVLAGVTLVEMTVFCAVVYAVYLLENTTGAALRTTGSAAVAGLAATAVTAVALVPVLGAVGAMTALVVGLATKAAWLRARLRGPAPVAAPVPV